MDQCISQSSVSPSSVASYSLSPTLINPKNNAGNGTSASLANNPSIYINQLHTQQMNHQGSYHHQSVSDRLNTINETTSTVAQSDQPFQSYFSPNNSCQTLDYTNLLAQHSNGNSNSASNLQLSIDLESLLVNTTLSDPANIGLISEPPSCGDPDMGSNSNGNPTHFSTEFNLNSNDYESVHSSSMINTSLSNNSQMLANTTSPASSSSSSSSHTVSSVSSSLSSHQNLNEDLDHHHANNNINPMFLFKSTNPNEKSKPVFSKNGNSHNSSKSGGGQNSSSISISKKRAANPSKIDEEDATTLTNAPANHNHQQYQTIRSILSNNSRFSTSLISNNANNSHSSHPMSLPSVTSSYLTNRFGDNLSDLNSDKNSPFGMTLFIFL
jgi:hypothetical protein